MAALSTGVTNSHKVLRAARMKLAIDAQTLAPFFAALLMSAWFRHWSRLHLLQGTEVFETACKEQWFGVTRKLYVGPYGQSMCDLDGKWPCLPALITGHSLNLQIWRELRETEGIISCVEASNRFEEALSLLGIVVLTKGRRKSWTCY